MRQIVRIAMLVGVTAMAGCSPASSPTGGDAAADLAADLVLSGGRLYTVSESGTWATAAAISDGRFDFVGDDEAVQAYVGDSTRVIDLDGRLVLPGLIDGHTHPGLIGIEEYGEITEDSSREAFLEAVRRYVDDNPGDGWLRLCCWPNSLYVKGSEGPHKRDLDAIVADRPVWFTSASWHSYWLNSAALDVLGVDASTSDPRPGVAMFERDDDGEPTGWVKEGAGWQFFADVFQVDQRRNRDATIEFLDVLNAYGVTTVYDGGNLDFDDAVYSILAELDRNGELPVRYEGTYMISTPERSKEAVAQMSRLRSAYGGERLRFRTVKLFMDGVHENHSGAMLEPYADDPGHVAETTLTVEELRDLLIDLHDAELDLHIHTIGDLAVRRALDGVEAAQAAVGASFYPRVTLAHLQNIHPDDRPRFGELGVSANFTAWWNGVDVADVVASALGDDRYNDVYTARPLFETGGNVTFSSDDWRLDVLSPFLGMQVAHTRQYPDEWVEDSGGDLSAMKLPASERLELELLVQGYTRNGAWPFRMEDEIGSIEAGKLADLVILDDDLFGMDPKTIHTIRPLAVMMEGDVVQGRLP